MTGPARWRAPVARHGVDGAFWGDLCSALRSDRPIHRLWIYGPLYMSVYRFGRPRVALTLSSTLAQFWSLRQLRHLDWSQTSSLGLALVARLKSAVLCFCGYALGKLGRGDGREDTTASRP
jgi:hypothetical protein